MTMVKSSPLTKNEVVYRRLGTPECPAGRKTTASSSELSAASWGGPDEQRRTWCIFQGLQYIVLTGQGEVLYERCGT